MNAYHITTKIIAPYPYDKVQTIKASNAPLAAARALRIAIKDVRHPRRIESYSIRITRLARVDAQPATAAPATASAAAA